MKNVIWVGLVLAAAGLHGQTRTMVEVTNSSGALAGPTNFFAANSNLLNQAVGLSFAGVVSAPGYTANSNQVETHPLLRNPHLDGTVKGQFTMSTTSSNAVYFGAKVFDIWGGATNQEMTGAQCDGLHKFYAFNDPTNGCKFIVANMDDSLAAVNTGQVISNAVQRTGFDVACGMAADPVSGDLFVFITDWTNGTAWASSNAVCRFGTNGYMKSLTLLGQQPYTVQQAAFLTNGLAAVCMFPAGTNFLGSTNLCLYNTNTWTATGGYIPVPPVGNGPATGFISVNLSPDNQMLYLMAEGPEAAPFTNYPSFMNQYVYGLNTNGNLWCVSAPYAAYAGSAITLGSMAFYSNNPNVLYVTENFSGSGPAFIDTNQVVGWSINATNPVISVNETGNVFIPNLTLGTNQVLDLNEMMIGGGSIGTGHSALYQDGNGDGVWQVGSGARVGFYDGTDYLYFSPQNAGLVQMFASSTPLPSLTLLPINVYSDFMMHPMTAGFTNAGSGNGFNAIGYYGNGSNLLHLDATNLEGALPAISGVNLTGLPSTNVVTGQLLSWQNITPAAESNVITGQLTSWQNTTLASVTNGSYSTNANLQAGSTVLSNLASQTVVVSNMVSGITNATSAGGYTNWYSPTNAVYGGVITTTTASGSSVILITNSWLWTVNAGSNITAVVMIGPVVASSPQNTVQFGTSPYTAFFTNAPSLGQGASLPVSGTKAGVNEAGGAAAVAGTTGWSFALTPGSGTFTRWTIPYQVVEQ